MKIMKRLKSLMTYQMDYKIRFTTEAQNKHATFQKLKKEKN